MDMLNAVKSILANIFFYGVQHIHINLALIHCTVVQVAHRNQNFTCHTSFSSKKDFVLILRLSTVMVKAITIKEE